MVLFTCDLCLLMIRNSHHDLGLKSEKEEKNILCCLCYAISNKMIINSSTLSEQFQNLIEKSLKEANSISPTHSHFLFSTGTSIKSGGVKLVLWPYT